MKKAIATTLTKDNIAAVLALLSATPEHLLRLSAGLTAEQLRAPLGTGERSFIEDLAHLINTEARTAESIYLALLLDEPLIANVHPERDWGKLLRHDLFELPDLLAYFSFRRALLLRVLQGLTEAQWGRVIREEGKGRKESVYWRARMQALHEDEHVGDLGRKISHAKFEAALVAVPDVEPEDYDKL